MVHWVNAEVSDGEPFQAEIEPFRLAKMNAAGLPFPPFPTSKPDIIELATCPVGPWSPLVTVNGLALTPVLPVTG